VEHEPGGLLGDVKRPAQLVARDTVLAIGDQPDSGKPLVEADRRILKDGPDLDRELLLAALALPNPSGANERVFAMPASGAKDFASRPAQTEDEVKCNLII
jgi:hypothetical protein